MKKLLRTKRFITLIAFIVITAGITLAFSYFNHKDSGNQYFTEKVERGSLRAVVNATGNVQAVVTVQVGSQVSGQIEAIYADYNSIVKRGQLLAKIDPRTYEAALENAKANLAAAQSHTRSAEADLATQQANLLNAKVNLVAAKVAMDNSQLILKRNIEMSQSGIVAQNDLDTARATAESDKAKHEQAIAAVAQAEAQVNSQRAQVAQAQAQEQQAKASVDSAKLNLDYCNIVSPVDGVVVSRSIDVGQTVAASLQAPLLFVIANDLTKMQVNASVDEADIGHISRNSDVKFTVDAYPSENFTGKIAEIRLNSQTVQNVVTYSVIINVNNNDLKLKPGMTANITITVATRKDALKIQNAALRYLPPGMTREKEVTLLDNMKKTLGAPPATSFADAAGQTNQAVQTALRDPGGKPGAARNTLSLIGKGLRVPELAPGQLWNPADKIRFPPPPKNPAKPALVWVLDSNNQPEARAILLGLSDGTDTEVVKGNLKQGDQVIIADSSEEGGGSGGPRSPFGFGARRR